jgi:hypothetical protein
VQLREASRFSQTQIERQRRLAPIADLFVNVISPIRNCSLKHMFFLVTGASGVGKSTIRKLIEPEFADVLEAAELAMLGSTPKWSIAWRHQMVERMVRHALDVQRNGKHFLLCGDPVPPGEVWAAPSADHLDCLAVCLLDASEIAQTARLLNRGDDANFIRHHVAFADWMRHHVVDPRHRPEVITQNGWPAMRWDRWVGSATTQPPWSSYIIETSELGPTEVAHLVAQWLREHIHANKTDAPNPATPPRFQFGTHWRRVGDP